MIFTLSMGIGCIVLWIKEDNSYVMLVLASLAVPIARLWFVYVCVVVWV